MTEDWSDIYIPTVYDIFLDVGKIRQSRSRMQIFQGHKPLCVKVRLHPSSDVQKNVGLHSFKRGM